MSQVVQEDGILESAEPASRIGNYRWWICGLLFLAATLNYTDRSVLAVLKPTLSKQFQWDDQDFALINIWFQVAYASGYLFSGRLMDVVGIRRGYPVAVALWSLAAMGHAFVRTLAGFSAARFALGLTEGGNFPASIKTVSEWFPRKERALATGLFNAGTNVGAVLTPLIVPWITLTYGWEKAFLVTGALGAIWLILWKVSYRSPEDHPRVGAAELAYIRSDPEDPPVRIPWLSLLRYRAVWATVVAMGLTWPVWWFYLTWVPGFLFDQYKVDLKQIGPPLIAVYLIADVGSIGGGWLSSALIRRGLSVNAARKIALLVCVLLIVPVFFAGNASGVWVATILIGFAAAGHQGWSANLYTLVSDSVPRKAVSSVVGMGGFLGSVLGIFNTAFVGYFLTVTHKNYVLLFALAPAMYVAALLWIQLLLPKVRQEEMGGI